MFHRVWSKVVGGTYEKTDARLYGYKRRKMKDELYPAVLPGTEVDFVDGIIYLNLNKSDIRTLDKFEGDYYQKETVECKSSDGSNIAACVYVLKEKYTDLLEDVDWDPVWFSEVGILLFLTEYEGFG